MQKFYTNGLILCRIVQIVLCSRQIVARLGFYFCLLAFPVLCTGVPLNLNFFVEKMHRYHFDKPRKFKKSLNSKIICTDTGLGCTFFVIYLVLKFLPVINFYFLFLLQKSLDASMKDHLWDTKYTGQ
jgi:hypothetical protein